MSQPISSSVKALLVFLGASFGIVTTFQSHLSRFLGYDGTDGKPTISELIWQTVSKVQKPVSEAIRKSELGVDYIPSNFMLAGIISIHNDV